jgi:two-component system cell cycle response regulator
MSAEDSPRILVIEDNDTNRMLMTYLLKAFGYLVLEAADGEAGVAMARSERPALILCDVHLPKLDGYGVVRELKNGSKVGGAPIVAVTALAMVGDRDRILAAGFDGYISKPIEPENFVERVSEFLPEAARLIARPAQPENRATGTAPTAESKRTTIMVIDDTSANREYARSTLEPSGYRVLSAESVHQALHLAEEERPAIILCDWHMVPLGGHDFLQIARSHPALRGIPIVIMSSTYERNREGHRCLEMGAAGFIERPIEPEALLEKIEHLLRSMERTDP